MINSAFTYLFYYVNLELLYNIELFIIDCITITVTDERFVPIMNNNKMKGYSNLSLALANAI